MKSHASFSSPRYAVRALTDRATAARIEAALAEQDTTLTAWHDADRDRVRFEDFAPDRAVALARKRALAAQLAALGVRGRCRVYLRPLRPRNWREAWKKSFKTLRIGRRLVVKPSWARYRPRPRDCVVELDPGMSFGTGQHATTQACLRFIDRLALPTRSAFASFAPSCSASPDTEGEGRNTKDAKAQRGMKRAPSSFLDLGCGSGILAIAAAKLGFRPVWAVDNDPAAVRVAADNMRRNGVRRRIACRVADLARWRAGRTFDVVAANVLADTLDRNAERVARLAAPGASLLLAGILASQYAAVRRRYEALGFRERMRVTRKEWTSGWFERRGGRSE